MRNLNFQPRLCRHLHLVNSLRSHTGCRPLPQLTLEAGTAHPPNTVTQMRAVPSFSPRQAMRKFGKLSVFSEIENNFRIHLHSETRRRPSQSQNVKTLERMGTYGNSESCMDTREAMSPQLKKSIGKDGVCRIFFVLLQKVL